jgi:hypothetical protein
MCAAVGPATGTHKALEAHALLEPQNAVRADAHARIKDLTLRPTKRTSPYQGLNVASDKTHKPVSRTERSVRQNAQASIKD